jgi:hypothetical protein
MHNNLFDTHFVVDGFSSFLLGDSGDPLLPWLMVPHRGLLPVADTLFNKKLRRGRGVVENAFGILKQTFRELLVKSELQVAFLPDVITCCAILHNVLLGQSHEDVERLIQVLCTKGLEGEVVDEDPGPPEVADGIQDDVGVAQASIKRTELGVYLALQRNPGH